MSEIKIAILQDESPADPRKEFDNMCSIVSFHAKYDLGDFGNAYGSNLEWLSDMTSCDLPYYDIDQKLINKLWAQFESNYYWKPVYLMDHSGLWIQTHKFTGSVAPWDSMQIGYIYISKKKVARELSDKLKGVSLDKAEELMDNFANNAMIGEINTYCQYISGDVWGYQITQEEEHIDSCWGFYGRQYCVEEAKRNAEYHYKAELERLQSELETATQECYAAYPGKSMDEITNSRTAEAHLSTICALEADLDQLKESNFNNL